MTVLLGGGDVRPPQRARPPLECTVLLPANIIYAGDLGAGSCSDRPTTYAHLNPPWWRWRPARFARAHGDLGIALTSRRVNVPAGARG